MKANGAKRKIFNDAVDLLAGAGEVSAPEDGIRMLPVDCIRPFRKEFPGDGAEWEKQLEYEPRSTVIKNTLRNLLLILNNDERLKGIVFNWLSDGMEIKGDVPWEYPGKFWRDAGIRSCGG